MAIRLVDVSFEHEEEVEFGTCELCMYTAPYDFSYFHFIDTESGDKFLSLIHISEPTRLHKVSRMPSSA